MMAAAIRYSYQHLGRTGTNPSVSTLLVQDVGGVPVIVGRGITALGGRPHAETQAISEAGESAYGATAYVSLEPCAHHGSTPPCAEGLIRAGIKRVVAATTDPDSRVSGRGYKMLRDAGIEVEENVLAGEAQYALAGYLTRRLENRPHITLKMALSQDGKIGRRGAGQVHVTGAQSGAVNQVLRAMSDAILIGIGTALEDDPSLTCRLPGLEERSPVRIVLDRTLKLPLQSALVRSAAEIPLIVATTTGPENERYQKLLAAGCRMMACDSDAGGIALPELLDDLAGQGLSTVIVEGGAAVARSFIDAHLVDRIELYEGPDPIGAGGIDPPLDPAHMPAGFVLTSTLHHGADLHRAYERSR
jgi:diaminohydroxyphosphoribosylaminopyrimidine deaminase/5-amino-6-(5-phosphoribosylamino)uracil reductase